MPTAAPMAVAMTPTRSDSLAPYRMRERMQRPNSSVPSGNSADGPARARGRSWRIGSWGATRGAASARRISTRISPSPATARRWRRKRRHISLIADARIEPAVEQVHGEVHEHEHHGHEEHTSLHHRVVALEDRCHGQAKIVSVTTAPPSRKPYWSPTTVTTGIKALARACLPTTPSGGTPLARAVVTYSRPSTSSMPDRVSRLMMATEVVASVAAGSRTWRKPSHSQNGPARPETGSQPRCRLKSQMATMATQKIGMESEARPAPMAR